MHKLDYSRMKAGDNYFVIPDTIDPCVRIRIDIQTKDVIEEHECVDYVWTRLGEEEAVWSWLQAPVQPDAEQKSKILKEFLDYAENEIVLPRQVC